MKKNRGKTVIRISLINIFTNLVLVVFKAMVGFLSNSIAIISDAVNNFSDALSGIITIIGTKLAGKAPDKKHPYGYGRIEYITSLVVSAIVLYAGTTALVESIKKIITPEEVDYSTSTIVVLVAGIIIKFVLGLFVKKKGRSIKSDSLVASGVDAFSDSVLSMSVLASVIIYMLFAINVEAYVGVLVSIFIIKTGACLVRDSVDHVLGARVETSLAKSIKREVLKHKDVKGAFDLVLNDYGPDKYLGSIHIEVEDDLTASDIDKISRRIAKQVLQKYGVVLHTIGIYSINTKDAKIIQAKKAVEKIVFAHPEILQMHGFYIDTTDKILSFDIIIDFEAPSHKKIYQDIYDKVQKLFEDYKINITLDVDTSD